MNVFEKILKMLEENGFEVYTKEYGNLEVVSIDVINEIVQEVAEEYNNGWIPCSERLPKVETEVLILAKRKIRDGYFRYIRTTAMYEDGTVSKSDSHWYWYDIECEYDKENECYIVPKGWREIKHYNPDECCKNKVDDEVIAWQPLPDPYKEDEQ